MYRFFFKRLLDIVLSFFGIIVLALPMIIIAIVVKCSSKGPAIFKSTRVGKNGKEFKFFKFRSMRVDTPPHIATRDLHTEEYVTKVGKFLRKTSLDELPQLFCIFVGSMSIIGPRPVVPTEKDLLQYRVETGASKIKPGLTGLAQVRCRDNLIDMKLKAEIDGEYAQKITLWKDMKIFCKTIVKVLKQDDVVEGTAVMEDHTEKTETAELAESSEVKVIAEEVLSESKPEAVEA